MRSSVSRSRRSSRTSRRSSIFEIPQPAMDDARRRRRGAAAEIRLFDERDPQPAQRRVAGHAAADDAAADDRHIEASRPSRLDSLAHCPDHCKATRIGVAFPTRARDRSHGYEPWLELRRTATGSLTLRELAAEDSAPCKLFWRKLLGTMLLVLLGDGVVANVVLNRTKGQNSGWIVITVGWGVAVAMAVYAVGRIERRAPQSRP